MRMSYRVLLCMAEGSQGPLTVKMERLIKSVLNDNLQRFDMIFSPIEYKGLADRDSEMESYDLIFMVDTLVSGGYVDYMPTYSNKDKYIVFLPDESAGSVQIKRMMEKGSFNGIYASEMSNINSIARVVSFPRTEKEGAMYYLLNNTLSGMKHEDGNYYTPSEGFREYTKEDFCRETSGDAGYRITEKLIMDRDGNPIGKRTRLLGGMSKGFLHQAEEENEEYADFIGRDKDAAEEAGFYSFTPDPPYVHEGIEILERHYKSEGLHIFHSYENGRISDAEFEKNAKSVLERHSCSSSESDEIYGGFIRNIKSYGIIDKAINDPKVSDIRLLREDRITVMVQGKWHRSNLAFGSREEYVRFIDRVNNKNKSCINIVSASIIYSDIDTNSEYSLRFAVSDKSIETDRLPKMHIRKIDKHKKSREQLLREGLWTERQAAFLERAAQKMRTILLVGGSGSGKTVVMNHLIECLPVNTCGIVMQEAEELFSHTRENIEFQHCISSRGEAKVEHSLEELATLGLLKNTEFFAIGEIKGAEASSILTASNTSRAMMATTHSKSAFEGLTRITQLASTKGAYQGEALTRRLAQCIDYVVYLERYQIRQIVRVVGYNEQYGDVEYELIDFYEEKGGS